MKKLFSLILALALCLTLGATALAESPASYFAYEIKNGQATIEGYLSDALNVIVPSRIEGCPVTAIGIAAFEGCEDLMYIEIPEGVTEIGLEAFTFCTYLTDVMLPDSLTSIGDYAFAGCEALREITIPSSVTYIGDYAFSDCTSLTSVTILGEDVQLGEDAFSGCESLTDITTSDAADAAAPVSGADNILPDAHAFFNGELTHSEESITNGTHAVFSIKQAYASAAYEYADLLQSGRFGLTLTKSWDTDAGGGRSSYYLFDCSSIGEDRQIKDYADGAYRYGDVILQINDWPRYGWCEIAIRFSDGLTVEDTGDRCTISGIVDNTKNGFSGPVGGGSPGGPSPEGPSPEGGGHWEWRTVEKDCPSCVGGTCPICHGTGTYRLYGKEVSCDRDCSACNGRGTITQQEYVFVND